MKENVTTTSMTEREKTEFIMDNQLPLKVYFEQGTGLNFSHDSTVGKLAEFYFTGNFPNPAVPYQMALQMALGIKLIYHDGGRFILDADGETLAVKLGMPNVTVSIGRKINSLTGVAAGLESFNEWCDSLKKVFKKLQHKPIEEVEEAISKLNFVTINPTKMKTKEEVLTEKRQMNQFIVENQKQYENFFNSYLKFDFSNPILLDGLLFLLELVKVETIKVSDDKKFTYHKFSPNYLTMIKTILGGLFISLFGGEFVLLDDDSLGVQLRKINFIINLDAWLNEKIVDGTYNINIEIQHDYKSLLVILISIIENTPEAAANKKDLKENYPFVEQYY